MRGDRESAMIQARVFAGICDPRWKYTIRLCATAARAKALVFQ